MNDATLPTGDVAALNRARVGLRLMPLDSILLNSCFQPRRAATSAEDDEGLRQSIARIGLLESVLLWRVPDSEPETWEVVAGNRRVAAFRAAGMNAIPYDIFTGTEAEAHAAATASNTQRVPLAPVDTWRAIRAQQEMGWALDDAARALGIPLRTARRLDKLGQLHPEILAAIETGGMPDSDGFDVENMQAVASAPLDVQARAVKDKNAFLGKGDHREPNWHRLSELCEIARIPKTVAIFDVEASGVVFDEDLFAEPGDPRAITTTDVAGFLDAQRQALQDQVAKYRGKKKRHAVRFDAKKGHPAIPAGWTITYDDKAPGIETYEAVVETGYNLGKIQAVNAVPPAKVLAERQAAERAAKAASESAQPQPEGEPTDPTEVEAPEDEEREEETRAAAAPRSVKPALTHAGQVLIAKAKTAAIRAALKDRVAKGAGAPELLTYFVLALCGDNISIRGDDWVKERVDDLAARLLNDDGRTLRDGAWEESYDVAAEAIALMIRCSPPQDRQGTTSGRAAEWIGAVLQPTLPRLDTPEILATVRGDALATAAIAAGDTGKGTTKALRERLANRCPDLKLPGCEFHAEGPVPSAIEEDEEGEGGDE